MVFKLGLLRAEAFQEHGSVCKGKVYRVCKVYRVGSRERLLAPVLEVHARRTDRGEAKPEMVLVIGW